MRCVLAARTIVAFAVLSGAACSGAGEPPQAAPLSTASATTSTTAAPTTATSITAVTPTTVPTTTTTIEAPTTTTTLPAFPPVPADGVPRAVVTPSGIVAAVLGAAEGGGLRVRTPCSGEALVIGGTAISGATVVLDPGHGGDEVGATGPNGLRESDLNLAVARYAEVALERLGATVVLTRTSDVRMTLRARGEIATALRAPAFVSIHHNGAPDGPSPRPGTETYFQIASPESRRLAGLVYEEVVSTFSRYEGVTWNSDTDAGAKYRLSGRGGDYYGILSRSAGVPAVLSEGLFLSSSEAEAALLTRPDVQRAEGEAIARAVVRFLTTADPGSGFVEPYPRSEPAGSGGRADGCVEPPLG